MLIYQLWSSLAPLIDRFWFWILSASFVVMFITSLVNFERNEPLYKLNRQVEELIERFESPKAPAVEVPIDFHFLDENRIEALYNQLEPDLVEQQRTVSTEDGASLAAGVNVGPGLKKSGSGRQYLKDR